MFAALVPSPEAVEHLDAFLDVADTILIGGAMMFPFAKAQGHEVGSSLCEEEGIGPAERLLAEGGDKLQLPVDAKRCGQGRGIVDDEHVASTE